MMFLYEFGEEKIMKFKRNVKGLGERIEGEERLDGMGLS